MRISVGPPVLTINHDRTFMVTDLNGNIDPSSHHLELLTDDTRFLSYYACYVDVQAWKQLSSATPTYYASRICLDSPQSLLRWSRYDGTVSDYPARSLTTASRIVHSSFQSSSVQIFVREPHGARLSHKNLWFAGARSSILPITPAILKNASDWSVSQQHSLRSHPTRE